MIINKSELIRFLECILLINESVADLNANLKFSFKEIKTSRKILEMIKNV